MTSNNCQNKFLFQPGEKKIEKIRTLRLSQNVGMELAALYYIERVERRQGRVLQRI